MTVVLASVAFWAPAVLILIGDDAKPEKTHFRCRFQRLKTSERKKLDEDLREQRITDREFLDRLLVDWDLKDKQGNAIAYTPQTREALVEEWDGLEAAMVTAYFEAGRAVHSALETEKNSVEPSGTGS